MTQKYLFTGPSTPDLPALPGIHVLPPVAMRRPAAAAAAGGGHGGNRRRLLPPGPRGPAQGDPRGHGPGSHCPRRVQHGSPARRRAVRPGHDRCGTDLRGLRNGAPGGRRRGGAAPWSRRIGLPPGVGTAGHRPCHPRRRGAPRRLPCGRRGPDRTGAGGDVLPGPDLPRFPRAGRTDRAAPPGVGRAGCRVAGAIASM